MGKALKTIMALAANAIIAGFFALAFSFINLVWLEYAIKHYPKVSYTTDYERQFGMICAAGYMLIVLFRIVQSRSSVLFPRGFEMAILSVLLTIGMIGFTPVPNTHFIKYVIDASTVQTQGPVIDVPKDSADK
jgi:hypothetical protein